MAAISVSAPGTEYGPCPEPCNHTDCAYSRKTAATACIHCGKPIGYEIRFFTEGPSNKGEKLIHLVCYVERMEAQNTAPSPTDQGKS